MKNNLVSFENNYIQTKADFGNDANAFGCIAIDGFPADENEEGEVIANVWMTNACEFIVDWHNNGYRLNESVLSLIEESKKVLTKMKEEV